MTAPAPWLAPDGLPWGARRWSAQFGPPSASALLVSLGTGCVRRTSVNRAARLLGELVGAGPLARSALWALRAGL